MSDFLLQVGKNPRARSLFSALGLPIPLPVALRRDAAPWQERPLADQAMIVAQPLPGVGGALGGVLAEALTSAGADAYVHASESLAQAFLGPGEAFGRPARPVDALAEGKRVRGLVLDATGLGSVAELRALYDFFHVYAARLERSGRVVVLGKTEGEGASGAAAQAALEGFVRSLAKELGRHGTTANLVRVEQGAESRVEPVLRFLLSSRSAFVTAQPFVVSNAARALVSAPSFVRPFEKKTVLVTGAARGIGEATAKLFAREGAHVICLDRPADDAATSQLARSIGGSALLVDLGADDAPTKIAEALAQKGGVDIVVHNAGITRDKTIARMSEAQWDEVLRVNLEVVVRTHEVVLPHLREEGRVVCLSSIAGLAGNVGQTAYSASKAGIVGLVHGLAPSLASRGITVNAVAPGFIETRLTSAIPVAVREAGRRLAALGQGGLPADVAEVIGFLASPGAQGMTGRVVRACGGALIGA